MTLFEGFVEALRRRAGRPGADDAIAFVEEHRANVQKALGIFTRSGHLANGQPIPASCYNDFYKFTMLPCMKAVERSLAPRDVRCTFSVNIRDDEFRKRLYDSAVGKGAPDLFDELKNGLRALQERPFDRDVFERCSEEYDVPGWSADVLDAVCGKVGAPRMLVQEFQADAGCSQPAAPSTPGAVLVQVFVAPDEKLKEPRVYVEATGPWHRVTWLETTLMQAVYEPLLRDRKRSESGAAKTADGRWDDSSWYAEWLAECFCRCVRSSATVRETGLRGGLMTGRRTGGPAVLLLQALYGQAKLRDAAGALLLLGTSSVWARYKLLDLGVPGDSVPRCMGTHAHELQMVMGALFGEIDDQAGIPLTQVLAHLVYFYASLPKGDVKAAGRKALMPMLTDTLGSRAFLTAAASIRVPTGPHEGEPFLNVIGAARQDSGGLDYFKQVMAEFGFTGALMASEIETPNDLFTARDCGYTLFGAGGFMGDSEKVWDTTQRNISMAVKVCRVYLGGELLERMPVKTGETSDQGQIKEGKFEADGTLSPERMASVRARAQVLATAEKKLDSASMQELVNQRLTQIMEVGM